MFAITSLPDEPGKFWLIALTQSDGLQNAIKDVFGNATDQVNKGAGTAGGTGE